MKRNTYNRSDAEEKPEEKKQSKEEFCFRIMKWEAGEHVDTGIKFHAKLPNFIELMQKTMSPENLVGRGLTNKVCKVEPGVIRGGRLGEVLRDAAARLGDQRHYSYHLYLKHNPINVKCLDDLDKCGAKFLVKTRDNVFFKDAKSAEHFYEGRSMELGMGRQAPSHAGPWPTIGTHYLRDMKPPGGGNRFPYWKGESQRYENTYEFINTLIEEPKLFYKHGYGMFRGVGEAKDWVEAYEHLFGEESVVHPYVVAYAAGEGARLILADDDILGNVAACYVHRNDSWVPSAGMEKVQDPVEDGVYGSGQDGDATGIF